MQWANPVWLWGLLGLAVPLAIHLLSRKEGKVVRVGSLRHLSESATRQFRSLKPNELVLFVLRSLLIILLVTLLAGLQWERKMQRTRWVLVERGTEGNQQVMRWIDSLAAQGYEKRYFEDGFPLPEDTLATEQEANYWYLTSQLKRSELEHAVIFSRSFFKYFKGKRESLPANVSWVDVPVEESAFQVPVALAGTDSLLTLMAKSTEEIVSFESNTASASSAADAHRLARVAVTIAAGKGFEQDAAILKAALQVLQADAHFRIEVRHSTHLDSLSGWVFWLSEDPLPDVDGLVTFNAGESNGTKLIERTGVSSWQITRRLNRETAIENSLVVELAQLLATKEPPLVAQNDSRTLPEAWRWAAPRVEENEPREEKQVYTSVNQWLALLFLAVFLSERLVAWRRNQ